MISVKLSNGDYLYLICIYRLDYIAAATFFEEFTELVEYLSVLKEDFIMSGDVNFHLETTDSHVLTLKNLFDSFDLCQHVFAPTHRKGHTLDFVLTRRVSPVVSSVSVDDVDLSDHFLISFSVSCNISITEFRTFTFRDVKSINIDVLKEDAISVLQNSDEASFGDKITNYNIQMRRLIDFHAPLKTRKVKIVPQSQWFDNEYKELRKKRRKAEKKYKKSRKECDKKTFVGLRKATINLALKKKQEYFSKCISEGTSTKSLFSCVNRLTDNVKTEVLPSHDSPKDLACSFNEFFKQKIVDIRKTFPPSSRYNGPNFSGEYLEIFRPATLEEIESIVSKFGLKCSPDDPIPSNILSLLKDELMPFWLELVNLSLEQGSIDFLKSAVVLPLLKGLDSILDSEIFKNYRPVSNLEFVGKLIERVVGLRLDEHMEKNKLHCSKQYGYKKYHSTETLLVKLVNDLLLSCDRMIPTLIMLLDLSAAFDTVDQVKMLHILEYGFGIKGIALKWFQSFLIGRTQKVLIEGQYSESEVLECGVPQGSILGPKLFNIYAQSFAGFMKADIDVSVEGYADDHQARKEFGILFQFNFLTNSINDIYNTAEVWMLEYFLKINCSKTLLMIVAPPTVKEKIVINGTFINGCCIRFVTEAKNLGFILDSYLCFNAQVKKVVKSCYNTLRKMARIRKFLSKSQLTILACALVFSQLDYCNALYYLLKVETINMLQSVQNSAARLVCKVNKFDHIPSDTLLKDLHWLKVNERIQFKILCIVHKCLNGLAPTDLSATLIRSKSDRTAKLNIPAYRSRYSERSFAVAGPKLWNMLPRDICIITDFNEFKKKLKTYLFKRSYHIQ